MSNQLSGFARSIMDVYLGGIIDECVVTVEDGKAKIKAMDLTTTLFVDTVTEFDQDDCVIGVGNMDLLSKIIAITDAITGFSESHIEFKPEKSSKVRFLLFEPDLVPSFNTEWTDDIVDQELASNNYCEPFKLKASKLEQFKVWNDIFKIPSIGITVKNGALSFHCGREASHQFAVKLGNVSGLDSLSIKVLGKFILPVLNALDFELDPVLYLSEEGPVVIRTKTSTWMIQPLEQDDK